MTNLYLTTEPLREILPDGTKIDTGPPSTPATKGVPAPEFSKA